MFLCIHIIVALVTCRFIYVKEIKEYRTISLDLDDRQDEVYSFSYTYLVKSMTPPRYLCNGSFFK